MKRRRTDDQWQALFTARDESGLSIAKFCEEQNICSGSFYNARKRLAPRKGDVKTASFAKAQVLQRPASRCLIHTQNGAKLILENPTIEMLKALMEA